MPSLLVNNRFRSLFRHNFFFKLILALNRAFNDFKTRVNYVLLGRPKITPLKIGRLTALFKTESVVEFGRVKSIGSEKKVIEPFLLAVRPGDIVFDIGASFGLYSVLLAQKVAAEGLVLAFEPESLSRARLLENLALNRLKNVRIRDEALGAVSGRQFLKMDKNFLSGAHGIYPAENLESGTRARPIDVFAGDEYIHQNHLPEPNVLKIDVEGMEYDVLRGLAGTIGRPGCRLLLCEVHFGNLEERGLKEGPILISRFLRESGFEKQRWLDFSHLLAVKVVH